MKRPARITAGYLASMTGAFALALAVSWLPLATEVDGNAYDWLMRLHPDAETEPVSAILAIDEATLRQTGGMRHIRATLAHALERLRTAQPSVVAADIILADKSDPVEDERLEQALAGTRNLVLSTELLPGRGWEEPLPRFARHAAAIGHVHAEDDTVSRALPLEKASHRVRRWALALEAFRLHQGDSSITETPDDVVVAGRHLPSPRSAARPLLVNYRREHPIPHVSAIELSRPDSLARLRGKVVFIGITALSAARDRLMTPLATKMSGVEIHATAFETLRSGKIRRPVSGAAVLGVALLLGAAAAAAFAFLSGWPAYAAGAIIIAISHAIPHTAFRAGVVFPYSAAVAAAWLTVGTAAAWQYFVVRRQLRKSESDKARYQQAIHFVTHEMRSPLTAIQGSSELIGRYNLQEDKRKQIAGMINSESKRLARMIQTFLDIERLTAGQMEMRSEHFDLSDWISTCLKRAEPLAARKDIALETGEFPSVELIGDRELMEYALYNLLTNAVKYSPAGTRVRIACRPDASGLRIAVSDQGIGMDAQELRNVFQKFYRTGKAEASGETGTGIGLSLVEQIVLHHGGRMEVSSAPGAGSCFTMVLPRTMLASSPVPAMRNE